MFLEVTNIKAAVVFYSMSGNTKYTAERISEFLGAKLIPLMPTKAYPDSGFKKYFWGGKSALMGDRPKLEPYVFDASDYDLIILGGPVWAGTFPPPLRTFVEENRMVLEGKRLAAFFCCSGGPGKVLEKFSAFLATAKMKQSLVLIDPKDKPSDDNEEKIKAFCSLLK